MRTGDHLTDNICYNHTHLKQLPKPRLQAPPLTVCIPVDQIPLPSHTFLRYTDRSWSSESDCVLLFLQTFPYFGLLLERGCLNVKTSSFLTSHKGKGSLIYKKTSWRTEKKKHYLLFRGRSGAQASKLFF